MWYDQTNSPEHKTRKQDSALEPSSFQKERQSALGPTKQKEPLPHTEVVVLMFLFGWTGQQGPSICSPLKHKQTRRRGALEVNISDLFQSNKNILAMLPVEEADVEEEIARRVL